MRAIVISYRRADTQALAGRIRDRLAARFGASVVFMDIDSIAYGADFEMEIRRALEGADVLVPVIGPAWTGPRPGAPARIHDADDPVRLEIETALSSGLRIVPVLVSGTPMPDAGNLPASIAGLATLNAVEIDPGKDFEVHVGRLVTALSRVRPAAQRPRRRFAYAAAALAAVSVAALAGWWFSRGNGTGGLPSIALSEAQCTGLRGLAAEAPQRFMGLRGQMKGQDFWEVPVRIDGFDVCSVGTSRGPAALCERALDAGDRHAELLDAYAVSAAACLGEGWTARSATGESRTVEGKAASLLVSLTPSAEPARLLPDGGKATDKLSVLVSAYLQEPDMAAKCQQTQVFLASAASGFTALKGMPDAEGGHGLVVTPALFDRCRVVPANDRAEMVCEVGTAVPESDLAAWMDAYAQFFFACLGQSFAVHGVDARSRVVRANTPGYGEIRMTIAPQTPSPERPLMRGRLQVIFAPP